MIRPEVRKAVPVSSKAAETGGCRGDCHRRRPRRRKPSPAKFWNNAAGAVRFNGCGCRRWIGRPVSTRRSLRCDPATARFHCTRGRTGARPLSPTGWSASRDPRLRAYEPAAQGRALRGRRCRRRPCVWWWNATGDRPFHARRWRVDARLHAEGWSFLAQWQPDGCVL